MNKNLIRSLNALFGVSSFALAISLTYSSQQAQAQQTAPCPNEIHDTNECADGGTAFTGPVMPYCDGGPEGCCQYDKHDQYCSFPGLINPLKAGFDAYFRSFLPNGKCIDGTCRAVSATPAPTPAGG